MKSLIVFGAIMFVCAVIGREARLARIEKQLDNKD